MVGMMMCEYLQRSVKVLNIHYVCLRGYLVAVFISLDIIFLRQEW